MKIIIDLNVYFFNFDGQEKEKFKTLANRLTIV